MNDKLNTINEQLDELLVKQLELIQDYINVTTECEAHQKAGFISLAKARYIQGSHSVSKNCLFSEDTDEEREALFKVKRQQNKMELSTMTDDPVTYNEPELLANSDSTVENQLNKQFGFLSSTTLKLAKKEFQKCLEKTMERAAIIEQSLAIKEAYVKLIKEKLNIQKDIPAP